ncbi:MAG: poly(A) polymerase [Desulfobaccales bacterium]
MEFEASETALLQPRIIPRPEHTLSRKDISLEALKVLYRLHHAGYKAYLVGGSVRDLLLGKRPKDFDLATDARPGEIRKLFRNSRIIGRRFRLVQVFFRGGKIIEVSTFRCRSEFDAGPQETLARNNTFGTPAEDAQRRDLTINGLFYNIADFSLVDYVGGLKDLQEGYIRVIGDPAVRFVRDPVRMLRVLRHAARTGFRIDPAAWEEIQAKKDVIRICPPARLRDELLRDLKSGAARPFMELMLDSGLFFALLPAWKDRLGTAGREELLDHMARLDRIYGAEVPFSENLLWAMFLTPYLHRQPLPDTLPELREAVTTQMRQALGAIEFPRQRQEETAQIIALAEILRSYRERQKPPPGRLARLAAYPEACLLNRLCAVPLEEVLPLVTEVEPSPPPSPRRRRPRRRRPRGAPHRPVKI